MEGIQGSAPPVCLARGSLYRQSRAQASWVGGLEGTTVGCGTVIGCLHPGQGTVFRNAGSVTLRVLLQRGQLILNDKDIDVLPGSCRLPDNSSEWFGTKSGSVLHRVHTRPFCPEDSRIAIPKSPMLPVFAIVCAACDITDYCDTIEQRVLAGDISRQKKERRLCTAPHNRRPKRGTAQAAASSV